MFKWLDNNPLFNNTFGLAEVSGYGGPEAVYTPTSSGGETLVGTTSGISKEYLNVLFEQEEFWDINSSYFHCLKQVCCVFPIRSKPTKYVENVLKHGVPDGLMLYDKETGLHLLTEAGRRVMMRYTSENNWLCTRINLLLAINEIKDMASGNPREEYALYAAQLKSCIDWQTPKWKGVCWRGALHSPLEILLMAVKGVFYFPSFISSSVSAKSLFFNKFSNEHSLDPRTQKVNGNYQNCIFEIDTSEYYKCSTVLKHDQTNFKSERENLFSCYNVFEWVGYQLVTYAPPGKEAKRVPLIRLKVRNPTSVENGTLEIDSNKEPYIRPQPLWISRKGTNPISRLWESQDLHYQISLLRESFRRYCTNNNLEFPQRLMGEIDDLTFRKEGFLDKVKHTHAENLYDIPEQDFSCFVTATETGEEVVLVPSGKPGIDADRNNVNEETNDAPTTP